MHIDGPPPDSAYQEREHPPQPRRRTAPSVGRGPRINPRRQGDLAAWFGSVPAVLAACQGNELLTDAGCDTNGLGNFDKIHFWKTPTATCPDGSQECVPYHEWVTNFIAVIGGR